MTDEVILKKFYDNYIKEYDKNSFKKYIINYSIISINKYKNVDINHNCKIICISKIINSLLRELFKNKVKKFNNIREELSNIIKAGNIEDIDKLIRYELEFYFKIHQKRLIDLLIENYIQSIELKNDTKIDPIIESFLDNFYINQKEKLYI